jgi:hypothetical protein
MRNLSRPLPARQILAREPAQRLRLSRRWVMTGAVVVALLAVLAWIDGGEKALRPIAQEIELPEAAQ